MPFLSNQECYKEVEKLVKTWPLDLYQFHTTLIKVTRAPLRHTHAAARFMTN